MLFRSFVSQSRYLAMCGISKDAFYRKFPVGSDDYDELREMLDENKIALKVGLRKKWFESDNATTQMALYKLCSTEIEHKKLQQNYSDITTKGEIIEVSDPFAQIRKNHGIETDEETDTSE